MPFTTITKCTDCGAEFSDNSWHDHDCRTPEQIAEAKREQQEWDKKFDYWEAQQRRLGIKRAEMSCYDVKVRQRAVEGKCILVHRDYSDEGSPYVSRVLDNPTWGTVLKHFDKAIQVTGDSHHCFLEGLSEIDGSSLYVNLPEGTRCFLFCTGS